MILKKLKNHDLRKQQDTIVYPPNKPHYCVPGCNFLWKASGENFNDSGENFNDGK